MSDQRQLFTADDTVLEAMLREQGAEVDAALEKLSKRHDMSRAFELAILWCCHRLQELLRDPPASAATLTMQLEEALHEFVLKIETLQRSRQQQMAFESKVEP